MSNLIYDLHTHTTFSHGKNSPRENIECAISRGLTKIAITDHAPGHFLYGVKNLDKYFNELYKLKEEYSKRIQVLIGLEFNIIGKESQSDYVINYKDKLDISLIGFHKMVLPANFKSMMYFTVSKNIVKNTDIYIKLVESKMFNIITHPGYVLELDPKVFAEACVRNNVLIEINNKHNSFSVHDLEDAASRGAKFIISSDAHSSVNVGQADCAIKTAKEAGILSSVLNIKVSEN